MTAMTMEKLCAYLRDCDDAKASILVVGHAAPDADAAVSSVMEAWRRQVAGEPAMPLLRCDTLPVEIAALFGDAATWLPTERQKDALLKSPSLPVVLTDHHADPAFIGRIKAVVDHHLPAPGVTLEGVDTCIRPVGATTTLVVERWREQDLVPDAEVARILLGAILLDTDGLSPHKTAEEDRVAVEWLAPLYGGDPMALFSRLRAHLLGETDVTTLYRRDYRRYPEQGVGFAILKVWRHTPPDKAAVRRLLEADVAENGYKLCVAKIALYDEEGLQEETYLTAGDSAAAGRLLETVCAEAQGEAVRVATDEVLLPAGCPRHGRKWYARRLKELLE